MSGFTEIKDNSVTFSNTSLCDLNIKIYNTIFNYQTKQKRTTSRIA